MGTKNIALEDFERIGYWNMECVKIGVKKQLDDLTYAQKKRDEEREMVKQ